MPGSRPNSRAQNESPNSTTGLAFALSSCAEIGRPRIGLTPNRGKNPAETCRMARCCGSPCPVNATSVSRNPSRPSNTVFCDRQSSRFAMAMYISGNPGARSESVTRRSGCGYENGRSSTALITEKMAVLAPMPMAKVRMTTAVKPGFLRSIRKPNRASTNTVSIAGHCHASRLNSSTWVTSPNWRCAAAQASSRDIPAAISSSAFSSRCSLISSERSSHIWRRRNSWVIQFMA